MLKSISLWSVARASLMSVCVCAGIAFPTCVSVNNCVCHFSPLVSDSPVVLRNGDLIKMYVTCDPSRLCLFVFMYVLCVE